ncbi:6-phosphofructokinase [Lewinella cohaerens]|uniref:6-phosphofructokinase n=1 Tax=Lewinella cohaerens TaxID=70995 RepID=UPI00037F4D00|nr:6-phosphofructokinase [Lewinella cohaerens]
MKKSVAIICAGGPAPGINTVVSTVAKVFLKDGYRVLGVQYGYKGLFSEEVPVKEFDFDHADRIFSRGGSTLIMSRFKPKDTDFRTAFFEKENVKLLVTIGGDDTASTANRITKFLEEKGLGIANIHVPKTIDNDLPLPGRNPTFGFHSAKDEGVKIGNTLYEDARTTGMWYIMSSMGRSAGHLAFGIGTACHFPMIIIPEMFDKSTPTIEKIINLMVSTIVKRRIQGIHYGVIIISEGVFHAITEEEILNAGIKFTFDSHGHPELGNVSKASFFNVLLQEKLKALNINIKTRPNDVGYELRCCRPIGFDLTLCSLLGIGVQKLYKSGISGCIVSADAEGNIAPVYLSDHEDENGKVKPRLVNMESEISRLFFKSLDYITTADYSRTEGLLEEPADYDFHKILNW